ncbi:MAG: outer membrane protein assembly factor BamE, partial [Gammaproteobacteria bacterium]|nr:outer membrane protein assembly factor BamE [Gammaproteobacteria bacterium]
MFKKIAVLLIFLTTACVYKLDVHQGNILEQKDVDKLRFGFTKNQVVFVLGNSVLKDSFSSNKWIYLYQVKNGDTGEVTSKKLVLEFVND